MEKKDQGTLGAYIDLFLRRKWLFLAVFAVLFAILGAGAMSVKTSFRATSLLAIGESEPLALLQPGYNARNRAKPASASLSGKTYATIVEGLPMAQAVASAVSNDTLTVEPEYIHRSMQAEFYEPELLEIKATAKEPGAAILIANTAADEFLQYNQEQIRSEMQESANFVASELEDVYDELAAIQQEIGDFKKREQVTNLDIEVEELLRAVTELEKDKLVAEADLAEQGARYDEIRAYLFEKMDVELSPLESPGVRALLERIAQLETDAQLARSEYGPEHPQRKLLEQQVITAREQLAEAMSGNQGTSQPIASGPYYETLRRELTTTAIRVVGLEARIRALVAAMANGRNQLAEMPPKQFELSGLELRASVTEDKYRRLLERLEEMAVEIEGIQGNATVLDYAVSARPTVSRVMLLLYVAILSALGAVAVVMTMEYRDNTIKSPEVISNVLRMTNFGSVPKIPGFGLAWLRDESATDHSFEHYRKLRANVRFSSVKQAIRCLMVTSSAPGEGKSSTAASLSVALSQMDQKVLLVDTDLRRPSLWRVFECESAPGVTDVLTDDRPLESVIKPSGIPNLDLLTSGPIPPNPAELFESGQMDALIEELRGSKYDMIVFDSAPTLLTTDTPVLAAKMDGVLVVLEAGRTTEEQGLMTKEMLVNSGARVLGAVLNKARSSGAGYYYYGESQNGSGTPGASNGRGLLGSLKKVGEKIGM